MAFVPVPKDLSKVKTKVIFNLTKRQLIFFSIGALFSVPLYLLTRKAIGNDFALMVMIVVAMPFFLLGIFEKDGIPLEKYARYIIRQKFINPKVRIYKTENFYEYLNKIERSRADGNRASATKKTKKETRKK
ncbi:PrgI family protein [Senegalia sp. (in: firmicutes)]|uniref:PrgI family protein n=1 Tax=Senegalia sp. (in: firmicutes) TaxID=1924098 RepID=UPI003F9BA6D4